MAISKGPTQLQAIRYNYSKVGDLEGITAIVRITLNEDGVPLSTINKDIDLWGQLNSGERVAAGATAKRLKALAEA